MEKHWLIQEGHPDLLVFALGWATAPASVVHIRPPGYDVLCTCDYRTLETITPESLSGYRHIVLMAWSFGVWAAERIFPQVPFHKTIALNGTPRPVDDRYGIPVRSFLVTLRSIAGSGTKTFTQRAYGEFAPLAFTWPASRTLEEMVEELKILHSESQREESTGFRWDEAVAGSGDLIFPPANQLAYWRECSPETRITEVTGMPHYPYGEAESILSKL